MILRVISVAICASAILSIGATNAIANPISATPTPSAVVTDSISSRVLDATKKFTVYLPAGYSPKNHYPVLYLLHGSYGNHTDWTIKGNANIIADEAIASGNASPMIIVMPDASGIGPNFSGPHMGYLNMSDWPYEDFFFSELIPYIDANYSTISTKKGRAIAGLSLGGNAAVVYAQRHPDSFSSSASMSGVLYISPDDIKRDKSQPSFPQLVETNPTLFVENADEATLSNLRSVRWYADCGDDDFLALTNTGFYNAMRLKEIPLEYRMRDGSHTWWYWQTSLPQILTFVSSGFSE